MKIENENNTEFSDKGSDQLTTAISKIFIFKENKEIR